MIDRSAESTWTKSRQQDGVIFRHGFNKGLVQRQLLLAETPRSHPDASSWWGVDWPYFCAPVASVINWLATIGGTLPIAAQDIVAFLLDVLQSKTGVLQQAEGG